MGTQNPQGYYETQIFKVLSETNIVSPALMELKIPRLYRTKDTLARLRQVFSRLEKRGRLVKVGPAMFAARNNMPSVQETLCFRDKATERVWRVMEQNWQKGIKLADIVELAAIGHDMPASIVRSRVRLLLVAGVAFKHTGNMYGVASTPKPLENVVVNKFFVKPSEAEVKREIELREDTELYEAQVAELKAAAAEREAKAQAEAIAYAAMFD